MTISGRTRLIAHLGYPTESFKAPMIYNPYFEKHDIDAVVVPMGCKPEDYAAFLKLVFKLSNIHGALVTMPHKVTTIALLDEVMTTAKVAGSCNAIRLGAGGTLVGDYVRWRRLCSRHSAQGPGTGGVRACLWWAAEASALRSWASFAKAGVAEIALFDAYAETMNSLAEAFANLLSGVEDSARLQGSRWFRCCRQRDAAGHEGRRPIADGR